MNWAHLELEHLSTTSRRSGPKISKRQSNPTCRSAIVLLSWHLESTRSTWTNGPNGTQLLSVQLLLRLLDVDVQWLDTLRSRNIL